MATTYSLKQHWRMPGLLIAIYLPAAIFVLAGFIVARALEIPFDLLTRDAAVAHTREAPFYSGYYSNLGGLLLAAATSISIFTGTALRPSREKTDELHRFLLFAGVFTALLLLTEIFMLHDGLLPALTGRHSPVYLLVLACYFGWGMLRFRSIIYRTRPGLLASALLLLAAPLPLDMELVEIPRSYHHLAEDGLKFLGIVGWSSYCVMTSWAAAQKHEATCTNLR